jgi:catechol 2,3-dioxygenase-like lactoylglutathione lyase family enzyme
MIIGAHSIIYSEDAEADRTFFRDVLGLSNVDVGGGWLIFGLPPAEVAFHPGDMGQEFYLMTDDIAAFVIEMAGRGLSCTEPEDEGWGILTELTLPSGAKLGVYEPRHARPELGETEANPAKAKPKPKPKAPAKAGTKKATKKTVSKKVAPKAHVKAPAKTAAKTPKGKAVTKTGAKKAKRKK